MEQIKSALEILKEGKDIYIENEMLESTHYYNILQVMHKFTDQHVATLQKESTKNLKLAWELATDCDIRQEEIESLKKKNLELIKQRDEMFNQYERTFEISLSKDDKIKKTETKNKELSQEIDRLNTLIKNKTHE